MSVAAVVVLYHPSLEVLDACIKSLYLQVDKIFVVDNSSVATPLIPCLSADNIEYTWLGANLGIGSAQNAGIRQAIDYGAEFVILSDQDTLYPVQYTSAMVDAYKSMDASINVAALAPRFYDKHREVFIPIVSRRSVFKDKISECSEIQQATEVIASGMFIPVKALNIIGLMNETLFIDWVDFEWCWRANLESYKIFSVTSVVIMHTLGKGSVSVAGKKYPVHAPIRYYYVVRNGIYSALYNSSLPFPWRINIFANVILYSAGYLVLGSPKLATLKYVFKGFWHGVKRRLGSYA
ncbi:MAG: glycosyltransferase family 2 protein [Pseudomonadota bacterium]